MPIPTLQHVIEWIRMLHIVLECAQMSEKKLGCVYRLEVERDVLRRMNERLGKDPYDTSLLPAVRAEIEWAIQAGDISDSSKFYLSIRRKS